MLRRCLPIQPELHHCGHGGGRAGVLLQHRTGGRRVGHEEIVARGGGRGDAGPAGVVVAAGRVPVEDVRGGWSLKRKIYTYIGLPVWNN